MFFNKCDNPDKVPFALKNGSNAYSKFITKVMNINVSVFLKKPILEKQMTHSMKQYLSRYHCRLPKEYNGHRCLYKIEENFDLLLLDLSKTFNYFPYRLIIAKSNAFGFLLSHLQLITYYLTNHKQKTKINNLFCSWENILIELL